MNEYTPVIIAVVGLVSCVLTIAIATVVGVIRS